MILRSLALRHGRFAIAKSHAPGASRHWRRAITASTRHRSEPVEPDEAKQDPTFGLDGIAGDNVPDAITADWLFKRHQRKLTWKVGADVEPHYRDGDSLKNPPRPEDITLELLLAAQCHLGHHTSLWHPANSRYIHGVFGEEPDPIHIISLDVTAAHLRRACRVVTEVVAKAGLVLFVGTRSGHALPVVEAAKMAEGCHLFSRWTPGTFSNGEQILGHCEKKVVDRTDEPLPGFEPQLRTRAAIKPDLVVCLNPGENYVLLRECGAHNIPTIGIIDTDVNPTWVTYPIPANDDSLRSVTTILGTLGRAAEQGVQRRKARMKQGSVDFAWAKDLRWPTQAEVQASHNARRLAQDDTYDEDEAEDMDLTFNNLPSDHEGPDLVPTTATAQPDEGAISSDASDETPQASVDSSPTDSRLSASQPNNDPRAKDDEALGSVLELAGDDEQSADKAKNSVDASLKESRGQK